MPPNNVFSVNQSESSVTASADICIGSTDNVAGAWGTNTSHSTCETILIGDSSSAHWSSSACPGLLSWYIFPAIFNSKWEKKNPQHWLWSSRKNHHSNTDFRVCGVSQTKFPVENCTPLQNTCDKQADSFHVRASRSASHDLEPVHPTHVTIFKKRVCRDLSDQPQPPQVSVPCATATPPPSGWAP